MAANPEIALIKRRYREVLGANLSPCFDKFIHRGGDAAHGAALGYRRAGVRPLFLERYLNAPIENIVSASLAREVMRGAIVEIGNFAADESMAMVALWAATANDLGGESEVAVATLTAPLRAMFTRIGLPIRLLAPARSEDAGENAGEWGSYYDRDPWVCAGLIAEGQDALAAFLNRRTKRAAA